MKYAIADVDADGSATNLWTVAEGDTAEDALMKHVQEAVAVAGDSFLTGHARRLKEESTVRFAVSPSRNGEHAPYAAIYAIEFFDVSVKSVEIKRVGA